MFFDFWLVCYAVAGTLRIALGRDVKPGNISDKFGILVG
jgi:hypothetical protein